MKGKLADAGFRQFRAISMLLDKKMQKNLVISKKSSNFAVQFGNRGNKTLLGGGKLSDG